MTLSTRLRSSLTLLALLLPLCALAERCAALTLISDVSPKQAKELGITVRSQPSAQNDARVAVEFKAVGAMEGFEYANLELTQGGKRLVTAALMPMKPVPDSSRDWVRLEFYADPAAVRDSTVTIYVYGRQSDGGTGYRLKMKDFVPPAPPAPPSR